MVTLVLGGARSGKSEVAERLAAALPPPLTYVATGLVAPGDHEFAARVAAHRLRRPPEWGLVEAGPDLASAVRGTVGSLLVDSLGTWVAANDGFEVDPEALCAAWASRPVVVVSEEVGLGVHPSSDVGRRFRDALGTVNRVVAEHADQVILVVAGRVLPLGAP